MRAGNGGKFSENICLGKGCQAIKRSPGAVREGERGRGADAPRTGAALAAGAAGTGNPKPGTEFSKPGTGISKPPIGISKPGTEISKPPIGISKPGIENPKPPIGSPHPRKTSLLP